MNNSIIDLLIRIKNGYLARREEIDSPHSKFKEQLAKRLRELGYIQEYRVVGDIKKTIKIILKYDGQHAAFTDLKLYSTPGRRWYITVSQIKPVLGGMGVCLLSTSKGILTGNEARQKKIGGELLCDIW